MKHTLTLLLIALCCNYSYAQYREMAPLLPTYPVVNQYGASLSQIVDTMYAHANTADTGEGGEMEQIGVFSLFWQGRVSANDSSGQNMFKEYYNALRTASTGSSCTGGGYQGNWSLAGPSKLQVEATGYTNAIWVSAYFLTCARRTTPVV